MILPIRLPLATPLPGALLWLSIGLLEMIGMTDSNMQSKLTILRTPEERFANLVEYPFQPHYTELKAGSQTVRMHYVDEGQGEVLLMLHGEPTWSYLYRKMIPLFVKEGYRVVAPDLIGFGKSDKLANPTDYSYKLHVDFVTQFVEQLRLNGITLVCQDWGGLLGLRVAAENEALFARIAASNTGLPVGSPLGPGFQQWHDFSQRVPELPIGFIVQSGSQTKLSPEVIAAYESPFPEERYKAAARVFPTLVPVDPGDPAVPDNQKAWDVLRQWKKPFLTSFSDGDRVTQGAEKPFQRDVPGAKGQPHTIIVGAGHFVQEDKGEEWARLILEWLKGLKP